jgi:hypothetical protein
MYINGVEALQAAGQVYLQDGVPIDYTRVDHSFGSGFGSQYVNGCISEFWFDVDSYVDWSDAAVRAKFYNAGMPVDLGSDGTKPGFGQPIIYLRSQYDSFTANSTRPLGGSSTARISSRV